MKKIIISLFVVMLNFQIYALPISSEKLAGTETAFIDDSWGKLGLMDSTFNIKEVVSVKSNIPLNVIGLYNFGVRVGYHFKKLYNLRVAVGYTWFSFQGESSIVDYLNDSDSESSTKINDLDLNIKGQKIFLVGMITAFDFNFHTNLGFYTTEKTDMTTKFSLGVEKTFFKNKLAFFSNFGVFITQSEESDNEAAKEYLYNTLSSSITVDAGVRWYIVKGLSLELGFLFPGVDIPLGEDEDTGEDVEFYLPVLPTFNVSYRF